jgi:hypothetical protein
MMLVTVPLLVGCGRSKRELPMGQPPMTEPVPVTKQIGPTGGKVETPSGAQVVVPAGALTTPTEIAIAEIPGTMAASMPTVPVSITKTGGVYAVTPHGTTFAAPVTLRIPTDAALAARAPAASALRLYTAPVGGAWTAVATAKAVGEAFEAEVMHFSFFVVGFESSEQVLPPGGLTRDLDILFMIDTSTSMAPMQANLLKNFPAFMQTLKSLPGGLPNVHVGVISSDLGAGPFIDVPQCRPGGDQGLLQSAPRGACSGPRGSFISASDNETVKNYDGTIEEAFSCIAALGDRGCGFEHQLASAAAALDPVKAPVENAGFLRNNAYLALILITNEDDCSGPSNSDLYDPGQRLVSDPVGPLSSFRCNEYGHLCAGQKPPRLGTDSVTLTDCRPAEDGRLLRIGELASFFKSLKTDPGMIFVSAIAGPLTPYKVDFLPVMNAQTGTSEIQPAIGHSCMGADGSFADPPVRIAEFVSKFGDNGLMESICGDSFAPALTRIGAALGRTMGPRCLQAEVIDATGAAPTVRPACVVLERTPAGGGQTTETTIAQCDVAAPQGGPSPCWYVTSNSACSASGTEMVINRTGPSPTGAVIAVRCAL